MSIQWFPGHMAKAQREVKEQLKHVDFVMELVDARAPQSSQNPILQDILQQKPKMVLLMKKDLADDQETNKWLSYFKESNLPAIAVDVNNKSDLQRVIQTAKQFEAEKATTFHAKGIKSHVIRAMILGIPNVGKSSLINRLANKKITKTGGRPGITRHQQWIKVKGGFEILDTPGILWPKFEDEQVGYRLAALGTIKDHLTPLQDVAAYAIKYMMTHYPNQLESRYETELDIDDMWETFIAIGKKRGALESGGRVNFDKVAEIVLRDLRVGKLGKITLERVDE
ncbi:MAG TPA: ribosome biogenesis GTPase YlqF [Bacillota bacterium]